MAFNEQEKQIILDGATKGQSKTEILSRVQNFRLGIKKPAAPENSTAKDLAIGAAKGIGAGIQPLLDPRGGLVGRTAIMQDPTLNAQAEKAFEFNKQATGLTDANITPTNTTQTVGSFIPAALPLAGMGAKAAVKAAAPVAKDAMSSVTSRFSAAKSVDELINAVDEAPTQTLLQDSPTLTKAKLEAPTLTAKEKFAGVRPDIKARIQGKPDKLKQYFDVAEARNLSDNAPYPFEVAAKQVDNAQVTLEAMLNDTGSKIGQFRQKISTYKPYQQDVASIPAEFERQLSKLNLTIKNGSIIPKSGKIVQTISDGEIKALQSLYDDIRIYTQSPELENAIALRNKFRNKINFDKSSQEVSNTIDPLSRAVQARIKEVAAKQVGKTEAANLDEYVRLMDALDELKSYNDRKAGGEFLVKQVLSERGGDSRATIETVKRLTGIDLMDDAVMARLATDIVGNDAQKGLFRQEITRAGLDAKALLSGDAKGLVSAIYQRGADWLIDPKQIYLNAAKSKKKVPKK